MPVEVARTVKCIGCANFRLKDAGAMAPLGFGLCAASGSTYRFMSCVYPRVCVRFAAGAADAVAARHAWMDGRRGKV